MAHYASLQSLRSDLPDRTITSMLDDDKDGVADPLVVEEVLSKVDDEVDSLLSPRFTTPLTQDPLPKVIKEAARTLLGEALYKRRGLAGPKLSWTVAANAARERLGRIGRGEEMLDVGAPPPTRPVGAVITEPARSVSRSGLLSV